MACFVRTWITDSTHDGDYLSDNIFSIAVRKPGVPIKFINLTEQQIQWFNEWVNGFSVTLTADHKVYLPRY